MPALPWQNSGIRFGQTPNNQLAPGGNPDWDMMRENNLFANQQREGQNAWQGGQNAADRGQQDAQRTFQGQQADLNRAVQQQQAAAAHDWATQQQNSAQGFQGQQAGLDRTFQGTQAQAQRDLQTALQASQQGWQGGQNAADRQQQLTVLGTQQGWQGEQNAADRANQMSLLTTQEGWQGGQNTAQRANDLSIANLPWDYKNKVFQTISPLITGLLGGGGGAIGAGGSGSLVGGQNTPQPQIDSGPVWGPDLVNQQVNSLRANNAAAAGRQQAAFQKNLSGQGYGSNSPLLAALGQGIQNTRMGADQSADLDTRWQAAQGNAQQQLDSQQAREGQWQDWNQADIQRRQSSNNYTTQLLAALAGMMG